MPTQNMHDLKDKVDINLGILSACEIAIFMNSPVKAEERPHATKEIIDALEEANKERLIFELLKQLDETLLKFREYVVGTKEKLAEESTTHENI